VLEERQAVTAAEQLLLDLAQIPGVYVPQFYDMAENGSVHPIGCAKAILRRVATPSLLYWVGTVCGTVHDRLTMKSDAAVRGAVASANRNVDATGGMWNQSRW